MVLTCTVWLKRNPSGPDRKVKPSLRASLRCAYSKSACDALNRFPRGKCEVPAVRPPEHAFRGADGWMPENRVYLSQPRLNIQGVWNAGGTPVVNEKIVDE